MYMYVCVLKRAFECVYVCASVSDSVCVYFNFKYSIFLHMYIAYLREVDNRYKQTHADI